MRLGGYITTPVVEQTRDQFKLANIILIIQSGIEPIHVCAQFGYDHLFDLLCEKYGADPMSEKMVNILHLCGYPIVALYNIM